MSGTMKWWATVVAALLVTSGVAGNVLVAVLSGGPLPLVVNLLAAITAGVATILAFLASLHDRLNDRVSALTEFLVARLNEIETHTGDRNTGFLEGYLLSQGGEATVLPFRGSEGKGRQGRTQPSETSGGQ
ncbi:hypothetical protein AB0283_10020 [Micromonospora vinacea]|uniref:hypothetical protein n=1 Tax=Micromonospora vinacea TaxID=709878 RepID=UPI00344BCA90